MKKLILLFFMLFSIGFSQYNYENNTERIINLKRQLKDLKELRDRVITKRWKDRRQYYNETKKFKEQFQNQKNTLEQLRLDQQQQHEKQNYSLQELEKTKSNYEQSLQEYQNLIIQQKSMFQNYLNLLNQRFPIQLIERKQKHEKLLKQIDNSKNNPNAIHNSINHFLKTEYNLTKSVDLLSDQNLALFDYTLSKGILLNVGTIGYAYLDDQNNRTGILLRNNNLEGQLFQWKEKINSRFQNSLTENLSNARNNPSKSQTILIPIDILRSRVSSNIYTQKNTTGLFKKIWYHLYQGGFWMIPLLFVALFSCVFILNRFKYWWKYCRFSKNKHNTLEEILYLVEGREIKQALTLCESNKHIITIKPLKILFNNMNEKKLEEIKQELQTLIIKEISLLDKYLTTIVTLGSIAPLIGLLGTVAGMINLFEIITLYGSGDPKIMAGGISLALITTQTGLAIAIPIILFHNYLNNLFEKVKQDLQYYTSKISQLLYTHE